MASGGSRITIEGNSLSLYLRDISRHKTLSAAEEATLAARIHAGDRLALERLVKCNLRFVVSVARNYQNQGMPLADLINEGNLGLIRAAKRFDEKKNFKFISYAVWWIRQSILQGLARQSRIVKVPLNQVGTIHRIGKTARGSNRNSNACPICMKLPRSLGSPMRMCTTPSRWATHIRRSTHPSCTIATHGSWILSQMTRRTTLSRP